MTINLRKSGANNLGGAIGDIIPDNTRNILPLVTGKQVVSGYTDYTVLYLQNNGTRPIRDAIFKFRNMPDYTSMVLHPKKNELAFPINDRTALPDAYVASVVFEETDDLELPNVASTNQNALAVSSHGIFYRNNLFELDGTTWTPTLLHTKLRDSVGFFVDGDTLYSLKGRRVTIWDLSSDRTGTQTDATDFEISHFDLDSTISIPSGIAVRGDIVYIADFTGAVCYAMNKTGTIQLIFGGVGGFNIPLIVGGFTLDEYRFYFTTPTAIHEYSFDGTPQDSYYDPESFQALSYYDDILYSPATLIRNLKRLNRRLVLSSTGTGNTVKAFSDSDFTKPTTESAALTLGNMKPQDYYAIYLKREIPSSADAPDEKAPRTDIFWNEAIILPSLSAIPTHDALARGGTFKIKINYTRGDQLANDVTIRKVSGSGPITGETISFEVENGERVLYWAGTITAGGTSGLPATEIEIELEIGGDGVTGNTRTYTVDVLEHTVPPVLAAIPDFAQDRFESDTIPISISDNDSAADELTVSFTSAPNSKLGASLSQDGTTHAWSLVINPDFTSSTTYAAETLSIGLTVTDDDGHTDSISFDVTLNAYRPVNINSISNRNAIRGEKIDIDVFHVNPTGAVTVTTNVGTVAAGTNKHIWTYTVPDNAALGTAGRQTVTITIRDSAHTDTETFTITVQARPPVFKKPLVPSLNRGTTHDLEIEFEYPDGDDSSVVIARKSGHGTVKTTGSGATKKWFWVITAPAQTTAPQDASVLSAVLEIKHGTLVGKDITVTANINAWVGLRVPTITITTPATDPFTQSRAAFVRSTQWITLFDLTVDATAYDGTDIPISDITISILARDFDEDVIFTESNGLVDNTDHHSILWNGSILRIDAIFDDVIRNSGTFEFTVVVTVTDPVYGTTASDTVVLRETIPIPTRD